MQGIAVTELSVQKPTLDEVFLTITGRPATKAEDADAEERELEASAL